MGQLLTTKKEQKKSILGFFNKTPLHSRTTPELFLLDFPDEIILHILLYMEISHVLNVTVTCKQLRKFYDSHVEWIGCRSRLDIKNMSEKDIKTFLLYVLRPDKGLYWPKFVPIRFEGTYHGFEYPVKHFWWTSRGVLNDSKSKSLRLFREQCPSQLETMLFWGSKNILSEMEHARNIFLEPQDILSGIGPFRSSLFSKKADKGEAYITCWKPESSADLYYVELAMKL
jgi:hypothetical protein